jgi:hypothetical protein
MRLSIHATVFSVGFHTIQNKVSFRGNGCTSLDRVETYLMDCCAELTVETGHDCFVIIGESTDARHGLVTTPGTYT